MSNLEQYVDMLKSDDPGQRKQAIMALARSGDPEALKLLADTNTNDPDQELRALAERASRYLQQELKSAPTGPGAGAPGGVSVAARASDLSMNQIMDFAIEILIWFIVLGTITTVIAFLTVSDASWNELIADARLQEAPQEQINIYEDLAQIWRDNGDIASVIIGFVYSGFVSVGAFILSIFMWTIGLFMGGTGDLFRFIRMSYRALAVIFLISTGVSIISSLVGTTSDVAGLLGIMPCFLGMFIMGWSIGNAHEFGIFKGCATMVMGAVVCCFCTFVFIALQ